jgi:hypothetical protein
MKFVNAKTTLPIEGETVLVRGWGEKKKHYIYRLAIFVRTRTGHHWDQEDDNTELFFEPIEWAELEQPNRD